ncbi:hypothetical protein [Nocardioides aurantiacus]|uniref:hypothetical protein n=1 Tax=Nocardioides aurantiacus TaxID=86796 RepID=UPI001476AE1D|nr:hypothetical protein [Nocardioides aurantiacus]
MPVAIWSSLVLVVTMPIQSQGTITRDHVSVDVSPEGGAASAGPTLPWQASGHVRPTAAVAEPAPTVP